MEIAWNAVDEGWLLIVQAIATVFMTGLIWFVQLVHYPLMRGIDAQSFTRYHRDHTRRTTWVVGPPMIVEGLAALILVVRQSIDVPQWQAWMGLALVALIWIATAALQVPQHRRLAGGFESAAHRRLVSSNWIRVVSWSARSILVVYWLL